MKSSKGHSGRVCTAKGGVSIPDALMRLVSAADEIGAIGFVFHRDRIVWANGGGRMIYPSMNWSDTVPFDDCFRYALTTGLISDPGILRDPESHLAVSKAFRARSTGFRFRRRYGVTDYDRHHVGIDEDWNAQVWFPVQHDRLGDLVLTADTEPWKLRRHVEQERALSRLAQVLDGVGLALAAFRSDGLLLDASLSMEHVLSSDCGLRLDARGRIAGDPDTTLRLRNAIARVASGEMSGTVVPLRMAGLDDLVHASLFATGPQDCAVLLVLEHARDRSGSVAEKALVDAYGLTDQEAVVAVRVATGRTVEDVARDTGRAVPTVRAHLAAIKQKIAVDRQHQLTHVLTRAMAMIGGLALTTQGSASNGSSDRIHPQL